MRIATCFYGLVGSKNKKYDKGNTSDPKICFEFYKKNLIALRNVFLVNDLYKDIFCFYLLYSDT